MAAATGLHSFDGQAGVLAPGHELPGALVAALMSGSHQQPDLICETFVLAPTDLLETDTGDQPGHPVEG